MDEFDFILKVKPNRTFQKNVKVAIGDDAAVYEPSLNRNQVVCVDTMVEGVHFLKHLSTPFEIGYKALAVNISDIAAMAGIPLYYLVSITVPSSWKEEELVEIYKGMDELAKEYKMDLLGGDTVSTSDKLVISVTVIGEVEQETQTLRSKACDGDIVFVTGNVGDSSAGLAILLDHVQIHNQHSKEYLINRHKKPTPRVNAGRLIGALYRASLNDVSDGLASELNEISEASNVGITVFKDQLPVSDELLSLSSANDIYKWILYGGEDFELVGTTSRNSWEKLKQTCDKMDLKITQIGLVDQKHSGVMLQTVNQELVRIEKSGYNHFRNK
ncbi:thiamine-phosphate kinase [Metabacillus endolithicus]|uniref:Thiamine-monophosphate kinase n=1 Tax=Metabacillus endolithicus TaxID=1535204 RepID=A0ABW5C5Q3_9BACI|nr:thiamine-phosphate kinase [Metabacillus endolithicus]UPG61892.1 thiamine-phosphate kinase [Metabacillus endolithicus]